MSKQYISTNVVGNAHDLDVLDVEITNKFTVTVSGDGFAKFWNNKQSEIENPKDSVVSQMIDNSGVHHVNVYENTLPGNHIKVVVLGFGCFNGKIKLDWFLNDDISTLGTVQTPPDLSNCWCPIFYKDPESKQDYMLVTCVNGTITIYAMNFFTTDEAEGKPDVFIGAKSSDLTIAFTKLNSVTPTEIFPISIDISINRKIAIGYTNGDVMLFELLTLKPLYTFHSTDLQISSRKSISNSIPRVVKFSPDGSLLVVARDNQSSGSINMYDVQYGENIGSLTKPSHSNSATIGGFAHDGWIMGLSFDEEGQFLASCGFDKCVRVWNLDNHERVATLRLSLGDFDAEFKQEEHDSCVASGVTFIKKGIRGGLGGDSNNGLCVISFDRGVRWYREAGGI